MNFKLLALAFTLTAPTIALANCSFTAEQARLIRLAASYGEAHGYKKTLAAIVVQESFVGGYVVRVNSKDGKYGSYGITHINLETAMWLESENNSWRARAVLAPKLMVNDIYALSLSVKKLDSVNNGNWLQTWSAYNGKNPEYGIKIKNHIRNLEKCGVFGGWG